MTDQFTPDELKEIRAMLESERRVTWLWSSLRIWAGYIAAACAGAYAIQQALSAWIEWAKRGAIH